MSTTRLSKLLDFLESDPNDPFILYALATEYNALNDKEKAIEIYQKGMQVARNKRDMHAFSELQGAYNSAAGLDYEDD